MNLWVEKVFTTLNYFEAFLILASEVTGSISMSALASLLSVPIGSLCNNCRN